MRGFIEFWYDSVGCSWLRSEKGRTLLLMEGSLCCSAKQFIERLESLSQSCLFKLCFIFDILLAASFNSSLSLFRVMYPLQHFWMVVAIFPRYDSWYMKAFFLDLVLLRRILDYFFCGGFTVPLVIDYLGFEGLILSLSIFFLLNCILIWALYFLAILLLGCVFSF